MVNATTTRCFHRWQSYCDYRQELHATGDAVKCVRDMHLRRVAWRFWTEGKVEGSKLKRAAAAFFKRTLYAAFGTWTRAASEAKAEKAKLRRALGRFRNRSLAKAFDMICRFREMRLRIYEAERRFACKRKRQVFYALAGKRYKSKSREDTLRACLGAIMHVKLFAAWSQWTYHVGCETKVKAQLRRKTRQAMTRVMRGWRYRTRIDKTVRGIMGRLRLFNVSMAWQAWRSFAATRAALQQTWLSHITDSDATRQLHRKRSAFDIWRQRLRRSTSVLQMCRKAMSTGVQLRFVLWRDLTSRMLHLRRCEIELVRKNQRNLVRFVMKAWLGQSRIARRCHGLFWRTMVGAERRVFTALKELVAKRRREYEAAAEVRHRHQHRIAQQYWAVWHYWTLIVEECERITHRREARVMYTCVQGWIARINEKRHTRQLVALKRTELESQPSSLPIVHFALSRWIAPVVAEVFDTYHEYVSARELYASADESLALLYLRRAAMGYDDMLVHREQHWAMSAESSIASSSFIDGATFWVEGVATQLRQLAPSSVLEYTATALITSFQAWLLVALPVMREENRKWFLALGHLARTILYATLKAWWTFKERQAYGWSVIQHMLTKRAARYLEQCFQGWLVALEHIFVKRAKLAKAELFCQMQRALRVFNWWRAAVYDAQDKRLQLQNSMLDLQDRRLATFFQAWLAHVNYAVWLKQARVHITFRRLQREQYRVLSEWGLAAKRRRWHRRVIRMHMLGTSVSVSFDLWRRFATAHKEGRELMAVVNSRFEKHRTRRAWELLMKNRRVNKMLRRFRFGKVATDAFLRWRAAVRAKQENADKKVKAASFFVGGTKLGFFLRWKRFTSRSIKTEQRFRRLLKVRVYRRMRANIAAKRVQSRLSFMAFSHSESAVKATVLRAWRRTAFRKGYLRRTSAICGAGFSRSLLKYCFLRWRTWRAREGSLRHKLKMIVFKLRGNVLVSTFVLWRNSCQSRRQLVGKMRVVIAAWTRKGLYVAFSTWRFHVETTGQRVNKLNKAVMMMLHRALAGAFYAWLHATRRSARHSKILQTLGAQTASGTRQLALRAWVSLHRVRRRHGEVLDKCARSLRNRVLNAAYRAWIASTAEAQAKATKLRRAVMSFFRRTLACAFRALRLHTIAATEARAKLGVAARRLRNGTLSKSWKKWLAEARHSSENKRKLRAAASKLFRKTLFRAWAQWRMTVRSRKPRAVVELNRTGRIPTRFGFGRVSAAVLVP